MYNVLVNGFIILKFESIVLNSLENELRFDTGRLEKYINMLL